MLLLHEVLLSPSVAMIISPRRRRPTGDKVCWAALPAVVTLFKLMAGPALPTRVSNESSQRISQLHGRAYLDLLLVESYF